MLEKSIKEAKETLAICIPLAFEKKLGKNKRVAGKLTIPIDTFLKNLEGPALKEQVDHLLYREGFYLVESKNSSNIFNFFLDRDLTSLTVNFFIVTGQTLIQ